MTYYERLISDLADRECRRLCRKIIRSLSRMAAEMQSGEDSALQNLWDEICVQVQGEQFTFWEEYHHLIEQVAATEVAKLELIDLQTIWLQTKEGFDWILEDSDNPECKPAWKTDQVLGVIGAQF